MCLLKLSSTNPNLSYVLYKNPTSGMQIKFVRQGYAYGYYTGTNNDNYMIYFRDGDNEMSYKEYHGQQYEYLNKLRYITPIFVLNAISEFLGSTVKSQHEHDLENFVNKLSIYAVSIDNRTFRTIERMNSFFSDFNIIITEKVGGTYKIKLKTNKSLYLLLNFAVVYFGLIAMLNDNDLDISESLIEKLINSVNIIDADYYIRYIVNSRILTNGKLYNEFKPMLEKPQIILKFGNTAQQRRDYIKSLLQFDKNIIDIGCGEGFYAIPYATNLLKKNSDLKYYAIDIDENELNKIKRKAKDKELTNIIALNSHEKLEGHIKNQEKYDVIITEVIEHMGREPSQKIIQWVLANINYNKIIITTPNSDFNVNYNLGDKLRHDDHKWELNMAQFKEYVNETIVESSLKVTYLDIGDVVNGISCTQGILIQTE